MKARWRVAKLIREARVARGMTVCELAEALGCTAPYVSEVQNGHRGVSAAQALRFADALDVNRIEMGDAWLADKYDEALAERMEAERS